MRIKSPRPTYVRSLPEKIRSTREPITSLDESAYNEMVASYEATPEHKRKDWRFALRGTHGTTHVRMENGKFIVLNFGSLETSTTTGGASRAAQAATTSR